MNRYTALNTTVLYGCGSCCEYISRYIYMMCIIGGWFNTLQLSPKKAVRVRFREVVRSHRRQVEETPHMAEKPDTCPGQRYLRTDVFRASRLDFCTLASSRNLVVTGFVLPRLVLWRRFPVDCLDVLVDDGADERPDERHTVRDDVVEPEDDCVRWRTVRVVLALWQYQDLPRAELLWKVVVGNAGDELGQVFFVLEAPHSSVLFVASFT